MIRRCPSLIAATFVAAVLTSSVADAQSVRVRSVTVGRLMQHARIDRTLVAPRTIHQGLSISAYDLTGDGTQTVDMHLGFRFFTDLGLPRDLRDNPWVSRDWNELLLDQAWVTWRPLRRVSLRAGRQFGVDALGMRDFDGFALRLTPRLGPQVSGHVEVWGGRDIQHESGHFDADAYDVQGLPVDSDFADGAVAWIVGGRTGLSWSRASVDLAYARRQYTLTEVDDDLGDVVGDERLGVALSGVVSSNVTISAQGSYHTLLGDADRAGLQSTWRLPSSIASHLSTGLEYVVPVFDSSSIFNLFGANPRQGAWLSYDLKLEPLATRFEVRGWGRILHGDFDAADLGSSEDDATVWGGAFGHETRFDLFATPFRWQSLVSLQTSVGDAWGADQWLFDTRLRAPVWQDRFWVYTRGVVLLSSEGSNPRYGDEWATSGVAGVEWRSRLGTFSGAVETGDSSALSGHTRAWLAFEMESWR